MKYTKTFISFLALIIITLIIMNLKSLARFKRNYYPISESAEPIYSGKIKAVFNPLDKGYVISDILRNNIKSENKDNFSKYKFWPVLSIQIDPTDLYGKDRGIISNSKKRGRLWERPAYVTLYQKGQKVFDSYIGIRIHGGSSRKKKGLKSIRLYFRKEYGEKEFEFSPKISLSHKGKLKRVISRANRNLHFTHDLGFSILNKLGGLAPKTYPVAVFINNKFFNYHFLAEHLDEQQLIHNFSSQMLFYKLKGNNPPTTNLMYEALRDRLYTYPTPLSLEYVKQHVDIENVTAYLVTILYTGMTDWHQGTMFKEANNQNSKWKWIAWDFDNAFRIDRQRIAGPEITKRWQIPSLKTVLDIHQGNVRALIYSRLIKEGNKEFKKILFDKINVLFEEVLTDDFLNSKFELYTQYSEDADDPKIMIDSIKTLRRFTEKRKKILCTQIKNYFHDSPQTCESI